MSGKRPVKGSQRDYYSGVGYKESARDYSRDKYVSSMSPTYSVSSGNMAASRHRGSKVPIIILIIVLICCAVGVYLFLNPPFIDVTVNGTTYTVSSGTALQDLIDDGYASPTPGDLIAVDGSIAQKEGGDRFAATVNGEKTNDPEAKVIRDAVITFENGADVPEAFTETVTVVPYGSSPQEATQESYYQGPIHLYQEGKDGEQSVKTGSVSGKTVTTITKEPVNAGYYAGRAAVGDEKVVALTFDDGPWPQSTQQILNILNDNGAKATFFVIGEQVKDNSEVMKKLKASGNQIATHTYDHANGAGQGVNLTLMSSEQQVNEVQKGLSVIEEVLGAKVTPILRAPGGNYYGSLVQTLSPYVKAEIGWDVDTKDWSKPGTAAITEALLSAQPGDIILCHDGGGDRSQTVEALRTALPQMVAKGYKFVTIDELMDYGLTPQKQ